MKRIGEDVIACLKDRNFCLSYELLFILISYIISTAIRFQMVVPKLIRTAYFEYIFFEFVLCILFYMIRLLYFRHIKGKAVYVVVYSVFEQAVLTGASYLALYSLLDFPDYSRLMVIIVFCCNAALISLLRLAILYSGSAEAKDARAFRHRAVDAGYFMDHSLGSLITSPDTCIRIIASLICGVFVWRAMLVPFAYFRQFTWDVKAQWPYYSFITIIAVFCLIVMAWSLTGHWFVGSFLTVAFLLLYTVITVYSIEFHGTVLTTEDFRNVQTARNVISSYRLEINEDIWTILLYGSLCFVVICLAELIRAKKFRGFWHAAGERAVRGAAAIIVFFFLFWGSKPVVVRELDIWDWNNLYCKHGLLAGTVESTIANFGDIVDMPAGYTDESVSQVAMPELGKKAGSDQEYPDIIMILNETWYDPGIYREDLMPDVDYMANFKALRAVKGYAVVPYVGGGTNASEYEMLTGNSVQLIKAYAPFNRINFTGQHSVVDYLEGLGYATMAAHPHNSSNYHRTIAWGQMGFDEMHFIDVFTEKAFYASRTADWRVTDISAFNNFARLYESMPEASPRYGFLLTMQNHGGWTDNSDEENIVHIGNGDFSDDLRNKTNEFLSCMKWTDDMIPVMTAYFTKLYEETGRRVVVYMTGDHAPSFIRDLSDKSKSGEEEDIILRSTPYFIWTNYGVEENGSVELQQDIDLTVLTPLALQTAGVPLSPYQQYALDLNSEVTVFTNVKKKDPSGENTWSYLDRQGEFHLLNEETEEAERIRNYFYLEYNNNGSKAKREEAWFSAGSQKE